MAYFVADVQRAGTGTRFSGTPDDRGAMKSASENSPRAVSVASSRSVSASSAPFRTSAKLRLLWDERAQFETYRLPIAIASRRFQSRVLELHFDVGDRFLETGRPDIAPFERVGGEKFDVLRPALSFGRGVLDRERQQNDEQMVKPHGVPLETPAPSPCELSCAPLDLPRQPDRSLRDRRPPRPRRNGRGVSRARLAVAA